MKIIWSGKWESKIPLHELNSGAAQAKAEVSNHASLKHLQEIRNTLLLFLVKTQWPGYPN